MSDANPSRLTVARLPELVGRRFAPTGWLTVTREQISAFADCTGDHQFIHVDGERVRRETPFPEVLAHGYLLLSLVAGARPADFPEIGDAALVLNYGIDRLRFVSPVFAGARVRFQMEVIGAELRDGGRVLLKREVTLEVEGQPQPAMVAQLLALYLPRSR